MRADIRILKGLKMEVNYCEEMCIATAVEEVTKGGGYLSFVDYDLAMDKRVIFPPFHWIDGWDLPVTEKKKNDEKMCAFAAIKRGLLRQTKTGYELRKT